MAVSSFVPQVWAAELLVALEKSLVYGQPGVVNTDYEGEISQYGDTVSVNSVGDPTIGDYTAHSDISVEALDTTAATLKIDVAKYFAFEVDDIEARQVRNGGGLMATAAQRAAYRLRDELDQYLAGLMAEDVASANVLADQTVADGDAAVQALIDLGVKLDEANVPSEGRWVVVPPAFHGKLLHSDLFVRVDASGTSEGLRNGQVGRALGFDVLKSNNVPSGDASPAGDMVIAGHPMATSLAQQINKVEAARMEKRFADMIKGLHLYGGKVFRPECLAAVEVTGYTSGD